LLDYELVFDDLEAYLGGKSRVELVQSIEEATVHIVGSQPKQGGWKNYIGHKKNINVHPPVPFSEAIELFKQAKIVLNCTPEIKQGAHERIFSALACGAAVLTLETPYIKEQFKDGEDILTFAPRRWDEVNHKIHAYLADDEKRNRLVGKGREKVLKHHTWDHRALSLIQELPPILDKIKARV